MFIKMTKSRYGYLFAKPLQVCLYHLYTFVIINNFVKKVTAIIFRYPRNLFILFYNMKIPFGPNCNSTAYLLV